MGGASVCRAGTEVRISARSGQNPPPCSWRVAELGRKHSEQRLCAEYGTALRSCSRDGAVLCLPGSGLNVRSPESG